MTIEEKPSRSHRDRPVWQDAMSLAEAVYRMTESFPDDESYGITAQLRLAATGIPSSIAEGAARSGAGELGEHLGAALGAAATLETLLELAIRLDLIAETDRETELLENVRKQLIVYRRSLRA